MKQSSGSLAASLTACLLFSGMAAAESSAPSATVRTASEWYAMGGWIMHVLAGCSMLVIALSLERAWALRPSAMRALDARVNASIAATKVSAANSCAEEIDRTCSVESAALRENLSLLSAFASLATMLGLLGTVLGMVDAFDRIAVTGTGDARIVADGIFRALVTTAAGLSVAVAATAMHALLRRRVEHKELTLARSCNEHAEIGDSTSDRIAGDREAADLQIAVSPS